MSTLISMILVFILIIVLVLLANKLPLPREEGGVMVEDKKQKNLKVSYLMIVLGMTLPTLLISSWTLFTYMLEGIKSDPVMGGLATGIFFAYIGLPIFAVSFIAFLIKKSKASGCEISYFLKTLALFGIPTVILFLFSLGLFY